MKPSKLFGCALAMCVAALPSGSRAAERCELTVHLAQANNDSPYAFVRAKFQPGELVDPWAVRFFDSQGTEVPYFVWDSITWCVAREGRADWGHRYALINHAPGDRAEVREARAKKLEAAREHYPELGAKLETQEKAASKAPDSVCAALYLLRYRVSALGKKRLTLRIYTEQQTTPTRRKHDSAQSIVAMQGELAFRDLPDRLSVSWKGKQLLRHAGFQAGDWKDSVSHADRSRPFTVETTEGIITKVSMASQTKGRHGGTMNWQSTYWLFPEGCYVALEGFSVSNADGYVGGPQKLSIWQADGNVGLRHVPSWDTPWWLHQAGDKGFVATHLFHATPLTIGFGNNPFTVNAEGADKDPKIETTGDWLALCWWHRLDDPAIMRLMVAQPPRRPSEPAPKPQAKPAWRANVDWLYRQYLAGVGESGDAAEASLRVVLGAAAGWIDRPVGEEEIATLLVSMMPKIATSRETAEIGLLKIVPALLSGDSKQVQDVLRRTRDQAARTDFYINVIRGHVQRGGKPSEGRRPNDPDGTPREGWTGNPCYHAALMPCYVRVLEHFDVQFPKQSYHDAILRYADFSLELLGGKPVDFDKLNATFQMEWPSRIVPIIPLVAHAYTLRKEAGQTQELERYSHAATMLFDDLMRLVKRNPHGYFPVWSFHPKADKYDTVYDPVSYERGITALWSERPAAAFLSEQQASQFVAAQARWFVYSGQLLDTLEMDNVTAIRASTHGAHTNIRNQIGIYLHDDFAFYRGLIGDLVAWSAASCQVPEPTDDSGTGAYRRLELSNAGSSMLRWALGIRPGSKWAESKVQRPGKSGFRLQAWNRLPKARPTFHVKARDDAVGLPAEGDVLQVELAGPAYRQPAEFEVAMAADGITLKASQAAKIRLYYRVLRPEWPADSKPLLQRFAASVADEKAVSDATWKKDYVEWAATPGQYRFQTPKR